MRYNRVDVQQLINDKHLNEQLCILKIAGDHCLINHGGIIARGYDAMYSAVSSMEAAPELSADDIKGMTDEQIAEFAKGGTK